MLHPSIYSMISWKISVAQTKQILYWIPRLQQQPMPHARERSVWTAVLFHTSVWALTCHCWQDAGFPLPFKSPGFMVLSPSRLGCPEIECLCWISFYTSEWKAFPHPHRRTGAQQAIHAVCRALLWKSKSWHLAAASVPPSPLPVKHCVLHRLHLVTEQLRICILITWPIMCSAKFPASTAVIAWTADSLVIKLSLDDEVDN